MRFAAEHLLRKIGVGFRPASLVDAERPVRRLYFAERFSRRRSLRAVYVEPAANREVVVLAFSAFVYRIAVKQADFNSLEKIRDILDESGFSTEITDDIQRIIWSKLFVNLSINTFTAITRSPIGSMIDNSYAWDFAEKMICEAVDVAEADGTHFSYMEVLNMVHHVCEDAGKGYSSMSQDVMNCRPTEIDAINGAIVAQAKLYNVPVPYNSLIVDLIHAIEGSYKYQAKKS